MRACVVRLLLWGRGASLALGECFGGGGRRLALIAAAPTTPPSPSPSPSHPANNQRRPNDNHDANTKHDHQRQGVVPVQGVAREARRPLRVHPLRVLLDVVPLLLVEPGQVPRPGGPDAGLPLGHRLEGRHDGGALGGLGRHVQALPLQDDHELRAGAWVGGLALWSVWGSDDLGLVVWVAVWTLLLVVLGCGRWVGAWIVVWSSRRVSG